MRDPAITHPAATIYLGDCLDVLAEMADNSVDAIVTDPPYGLGFMGKAWDDLPPGLDWAVECLRVLKPGGHLLAFGGTRTWHRLAVAVEDAGFEVRDSIAWLYGSGFPKSLDVSKAIDKAAGATREVVGVDAAARARRPNVAANFGVAGRYHWGDAHLTWDELPTAGREHYTTKLAEAGEITAPATPAAQQWAGWGTALKPAFEPIVVARKPLLGTVAANVLAHGTGALNIDGTRVGDGSDRTSGGVAQGPMPQPMSWGQEGRARTERASGGRWPANVLLDGSQADALDEQSGTLKTGGGNRASASGGVIYHERAAGETRTFEANEGGASRFFPTFRYQAKAPTRERPVVVAEDGTKTAHPTVKPLALMRWLVTLVTPPGGVVLDTFAGSGATIEAAALEGFQSIGIEREADYLPLIQVRLDRLPVAEEESA